MSLVAYIDESLLKGEEITAYVLAASVLAAASCGSVRGQLVADLTHNGPAFHWKDAKPIHRIAAVETVAAIRGDVRHVW